MNKPAERPLVAVVGGDSLLGREICELLGDSKPAPKLQLISAGAATLSADEEEAVLMLPLAKESLTHSRVALLAGSPASSRRALKLNQLNLSQEDRPILIDLTGALEEQPTARLRAPSAEAGPALESKIYVIAHPAAIALAILLARLADIAAIRRSVVHVFEPASERGQRGLDELQQQTVAVLAFQKVKADVFDSQLGFNLLARYGEEALEPLEGIEQRVERHLASLLSGYPAIPMPSLRLIQAPVFHGHSFSVWVEFEENPGPEKLVGALSDAGLDVRLADPPSNTGITGQSGLSLGAIARDTNHARACWLWMVADNLRLAAESAVAVAKESL